MTYGETLRMSRRMRRQLSDAPDLITDHGDQMGDHYRPEFAHDTVTGDAITRETLAAQAPTNAERSDPACVMAITNMLMRQPKMVKFHSADVREWCKVHHPQSRWIWSAKTIGDILGDIRRADSNRVEAMVRAHVSTTRGAHRQFLTKGRDDKGWWYRIEDWREGTAWVQHFYVDLAHIARVRNNRLRDGDRRTPHTASITIAAGMIANQQVLGDTPDMDMQVDALFEPPKTRRNGHI